MSAKQQINKTKLIKWSALVKEQSESGLGVRAWCSQNNISKDTFYYWKRKVRQELIDSTTPDIVQVLPATPSANPINTESVNSPVCVTPSVSHNFYNLSDTHDDSKTITISSNDIHIELPISTHTNLITGIIEVLCHA